MTAQPEPRGRDEHHPIVDLAARIGLTAHLGGPVTTDMLIARCGVRPTHRVLEVGCGTGTTAAHLARTIGCDLTTSDVHPKMVEWTRRTLANKGVRGRVDVVEADVHALPWPDDHFDVVFCEGPLMFVDDKVAPLREMARVTRPGGRVGVNEVILTDTDVPESVSTFFDTAIEGIDMAPLDAWSGWFRGAGLQRISAEQRAVRLRDELRGVRWTGVGEFGRAYIQLIRLWLSDPDLRDLVGTQFKAPRHTASYLGSGVCVGEVA